MHGPILSAYALLITACLVLYDVARVEHRQLYGYSEQHKPNCSFMASDWGRLQSGHSPTISTRYFLLQKCCLLDIFSFLVHSL